MAVDYFLSSCQTILNSKAFGLYDDPDRDHVAACVLENDEGKWIAIVHNKDEQEVAFYALDHCTPVTKEGDPTKQASLCDGLLVVEQFYTFVELKDCKLKDKNWRPKGKAQLEATILRFLKENPSIKRQNVAAFLCNKKHQKTNSIYQDSQEEFIEKTGVILRIHPHISL